MPEEAPKATDAVKRLQSAWQAARTFGSHFLAAVGVLALAAGLADAFQPDLLPSRNWTALVGLGVAAVYAIWKGRPRKSRVLVADSSFTISLVRGDLLDAPRSVIAIPVSDTFDIAEPEISAHSLQGQFLQKVYAGNALALDSAINSALAPVQTIGTVRKRGKVDRYPVGTAISVPHGKYTCVLVALSTMDERNVTRSTANDLWTSWGKVWEEVRATANGGLVRVPVMGGGLSRLQTVLPLEDALRLAVISFLAASRHTFVCGRLEIVVPRDDYVRLQGVRFST